MLVEAFNRLIYQEHADAILILIGRTLIGREQNIEASRNIHQQLKQSEREHEHIHLIGERANATDYLHTADFFCLSSLYEGMPMTLIEAFAAGAIPVCTPAGGIPEMIQELDTSLLSESVHVDDYYQALKRAYTLPKEKQQALKQQSKQLFKKKYSIEQCARNYLALYEKLLGLNNRNKSTSIY